jgi:hypothetical protein
MKASITCKKAVDLISKKEEGRLSLRQRFQLWRHLAVCSLCKTFAAQNKVIKQAFQQKAKATHSLSDDEKASIAQRVFDSE